MSRKPRVNPQVPTRDVDWWLGGIHVRTPDEHVAAMLEELMDKAHFERQAPPGMSAVEVKRWLRTIRSQTVRYALWRHHRNLEQALAVGLR